MPTKKRNSDPGADLQLRIVGVELPGTRFEDPQSAEGPIKEGVCIGIQRGREVIDVVPADGRRAEFSAHFTVGKQPDGKPNFLGPYAQGTPADRFVYLSWGARGPFGAITMFRRLKIKLRDLSWKVIREAIADGKPITVTLRLTDAKGGPLCATPPKTHVRWEGP